MNTRKVIAGMQFYITGEEYVFFNFNDTMQPAEIDVGTWIRSNSQILILKDAVTCALKNAKPAYSHFKMCWCLITTDNGKTFTGFLSEYVFENSNRSVSL